jgi:hypothetical protein
VVAAAEEAETAAEAATTAEAAVSLEAEARVEWMATAVAIVAGQMVALVMALRAGYPERRASPAH